MDTLPRVTSIIEKEMIKNPAFVQKDTEMIHPKSQKRDKDQLLLEGRLQCQEHSVNSVHDEACHGAGHDDSRRCSQHC